MKRVSDTVYGHGRCGLSEYYSLARSSQTRPHSLRPTTFTDGYRKMLQQHDECGATLRCDVVDTTGGCAVGSAWSRSTDLPHPEHSNKNRMKITSNDHSLTASSFRCFSSNPVDPAVGVDPSTTPNRAQSSGGIQQRRQRNVRPAFVVLLQHLPVVHLVNVVAGENEDVFGLLRANGINILITASACPIYQLSLTRSSAEDSMNSPISRATMFQPSRICRLSERALYCVKINARKSEFTQLESVISIMR